MTGYLRCFAVLAILAGFAAPLPAAEMVVCRVHYESREVLNVLASELDIWEVHHDLGYAVAGMSRREYDQLRAQGYRVEIDDEKTALVSDTKSIANYASYRTVEETYAAMESLAEDYPDLCSLLDIGDSWEKSTVGDPAGYDLLVLVLTNRNISGDKFKFFLHAETHARELATAEIALRFAEHLLAGYGTDPDVTWLLDYGEVHIMPMSNPDGRKWAEQGYYWRKNTDRDDGCDTFPDYGTDLNRNCGFHWGEAGDSPDPGDEVYRGSAPDSEPETVALEVYLAGIFRDQRGPGEDDPAPDDATGLSLSLHSYGDEVLWPWGWGYETAPNHAQLARLARKFAFFNGYEAKKSSALYPASGTTDDWTYGVLGVAAYTFEVGTSFFQDAPTFENTIWPDNRAALIHGFKTARRPYLMPLGPDTIGPALGIGPVLTATADGTRFSAGETARPVAAARYSFEAPSWAAGAVTHEMSAADGSFDSPVETVSALVGTGGLAVGRHIILVESSDTTGHWGAPSAVFFDLDAGDVNGDGVCNVADAVLGLRMALEMGVTTGGTEYAPEYPGWLTGRADLNGDGVIDTGDVVQLLNRGVFSR